VDILRFASLVLAGLRAGSEFTSRLRRHGHRRRVSLSASVGGCRDRQQRRRPKSRHMDGSGYAADIFLHGPCTGR
jgi:hypothetical protein